MTNLPDMAGAAAEITLGDKTYLMRPLSIDEIAQFERWVDDAPIRQAVRNLGGLSAELRIELLRQAQETAQKASLQSPEIRQERITAQMSSMNGICYLIWLSLRREQPELTQEEVAQRLTMESLPYVQERLDSINGFSSPSPNRVSKKAPRKARPKRKSR